MGKLTILFIRRYRIRTDEESKSRFVLGGIKYDLYSNRRDMTAGGLAASKVSVTAILESGT